MKDTKNTVTIYVTKFAIEDGGYFKADAIIYDDDLAKVIDAGFLVHHGEFFFNEKDAMENCEQRRKDKIDALEKQKADIQNIKFGLLS